MNLVFATSNTRVINENNVPDIIVNLGSSDYFLTDTILNPVTKNNVETYIVKENMPISFSFANHQIVSDYALINNYYYSTFKNKNIIIRCMDKLYTPSSTINMVENSCYQILKTKKRLEDCLFVFDVNYSVNVNNETVDKTQSFYFMVVSEKEFDMYKSMTRIEENNDGEIKRPKAQK